MGIDEGIHTSLLSAPHAPQVFRVLETILGQVCAVDGDESLAAGFDDLVDVVGVFLEADDAVGDAGEFVEPWVRMRG